jgi:hypothetical protein
MEPPDPSTWPGPRPFVGREDVLRHLRRELVAAMEETGRAVILHGPPGSGRAALARRLISPARQGGVRVAIGDAADPEEPAWNQIAFQLTARRRALKALGRTASKWIGLIPLLGGTFEAIMDTARTLNRRRRGGSAPASYGTGSTVDKVRLLLAEAPLEPRLIILENLEASDPSEIAGAFALAQRIGQTRTLFIGTSTSTGGRLPKDVAELRDQIVRYRNGDELAIPPMTTEECCQAVEQATGGPLPPEWRAWLESRAPATPEKMWGLLGQLAARGVLVEGKPADTEDSAWTWTRSPEPADDALVAIQDEEVEDLSGQEKQILATAARMGAVFEVRMLADRLGVDELELQERLDRLVRRGRLRFEGTEEVDDDFIDRYAFPDARTAALWAARQEP